VKKLTSHRLLTALAETETPAFIAVAQNTGRLIRAEKGLELAIRLIEQQKNSFYLKESDLLTLKHSYSS
jgi:hypothetical protein